MEFEMKVFMSRLEANTFEANAPRALRRTLVQPAPYFAPGRIGSLEVRNRLIRAATSETMATAEGEVTDDLIGLYTNLAKGGAGLLITGHMYVEQRGQCSPRQIGIYSDHLLPGLKRLTRTVHAHGGLIFSELSHAGSQSVMPDIAPIAPSMTTNEIFGREAREMFSADIQAVISGFADAARRAVAAGFDGIHLHGGNGYLIAQFSSPYTNRRNDEWGGDAARRDRFFLAVYEAVRQAVGPEFPVSARVGLADSIAGGLEIEEGISRAVALAGHGLDAIEVSYGVMKSYLDNIRPYVGLSMWRAMQDWVLPRLWTRSAAEAYYRPFARAIKNAADVPVILVGGLRTTDTMADVLHSGDADFLAFARPFIRESDFPNALQAGRQGTVDCVSCNICLAHDGLDPLRCWRKNVADLAYHGYCRFWRDRAAH
jgi:2,4-dienoyl-CoA reductase-like NADH-dependent reductase (Old Yellow Enzyme family)